MDPLSVIASTIAVVQAISSTYKAIQHVRGLPDEFNEVNWNLPLAKNTLDLARDQLQGLALDESSKMALQPLVSDCKEKAEMLQDIFEKVEKGVKNTKDGSVLDFYRTSLLRLGKAHRVETLMRDILKGLDVLATNQLFRTATQSQMAQLKEAIDQLSNMESSVPDSDFESSRTNFAQNIASGGTGYQPVNTGQGQYINSGSGKQFNAHTMTFVQSNKDNKTRSNILQTLHTSPYLDRKNRNPDRVDGTCRWFVHHSQFQQWRESKSSSMLWVSANPGCGKSVLAKYLVDSELKTTESRTTCYFFFKDDFEDQRSANSALSCILHRLFTQRQELFSDKIVKRFEANRAHLTTSFDELWEVLVIASQDENVSELVCILDAFDECEDQEQLKLAQALRKFYDPENNTKVNANLKFLVTSRPYDKIGRGFQPLNIPGLPVIHLKGESGVEISKIAREIDVYIEHKVSCIRAKLDLKPDEEQLLLQELRRVPNQTYLWVRLTLELIEDDISIDKTKICEATSSLPRTVDDAYERILAKSSNSEEAKKLLHIIVAAARPLTLAEMNLALALRQNHRSYKDINDKPEERFGRYIRDLCGLFVTITDSKIYLLHQTAKEFLVPKDDPDPRGDQGNPLIWKSSLQPADSHRILCEICIWHLLFTEFETHPLDENLHKNLDQKVSRYLRDHVFLDYSATNWAAHFRASGVKGDAVIESLLRICDAGSRRCQTWFRIYWAGTHTRFPRDFTTLKIASYFGLEQIVKLLLRMDDVEVDARDGTYQRSALSWASENGFDGVVELLIKGPKLRRKHIAKLSFPQGAKVDARDRYGRTPLSYAAWNGHMAIVQRLVKGGARLDSKDEIGGTPISYALCSGHEDVARRLMGGTPVDSVDQIRRDLLIPAAEKGYEAIVKRLLDNGAATEVVDSTGRTPLSWAAESGREAVVKLLVKKGANLETRDKDGRTPLSLAAESGHETVARLLAEKGADPETRDKDSRTPLLLAAESGHEAVIRLLVKKGANLETRDKDGRTPLSLAAESGHETVARLLAEKGADPETRDKDGRTPLSLAAESGRETVARLLVEKGADLETRDKDGRTPLSLAAVQWREAIIRMLIEKGANLETKNKDGRTPLSLAAVQWCENVVRLLVEKGADLDTKDRYDRTPLLWAARDGYEGVFRLLIEEGANPNIKDKDDQTLQSLAAMNEREAVNRDSLDEIFEDLIIPMHDSKGYKVERLGRLMLHDCSDVITSKNDQEKDHEIYLFEYILLCFKEISARNKDKMDKTRFLGPRRDTNARLQLKNRLFITDIRDIMSMSKPGSHYVQIWWDGNRGVETLTLKFTHEDIKEKWASAFEQLRRPYTSYLQHGQATAPAQLEMRVKCENGNYVTLVVGFNITYQRLINRIDAKLARFTNSSIDKGLLKLQYRDEEGDFVIIQCDDDVKIALMEWRRGVRNTAGEMELFCVSN